MRGTTMRCLPVSLNLETLESRTSCSALSPGPLTHGKDKKHEYLDPAAQVQYLVVSGASSVSSASSASITSSAFSHAVRPRLGSLPWIPPIYASCDPWYPWGYHLNDRLGTCVPAAEVNVLEAQLHSVGYSWSVPDSSVLTQYERVGHYNPSNPATDQGETVVAAEFDWVRNGYKDPSGYAHKARAWGPVNFRDNYKLAEAVYLYEGVTLTVALPADAITQLQSGQIWSVTGGPGGAPWSSGAGHEVAIIGFNYTGPITVTWGRPQQATWAWMQTYGTEAYATVNPDEIGPNGRAANGLTITQLIADLRYVA